LRRVGRVSHTGVRLRRVFREIFCELFFVYVSTLKGLCHKIFCFRFFSFWSFQIRLKILEIFKSQGAPLVSTAPVANLPLAPLMLLISEANLPPVSTILAANLPPVSITPVVHLALRIRPKILKKIEAALMVVYSGAWGKLIHEKNLKSKIS
jgi:hypothetical protein